MIVARNIKKSFGNLQVLKGINIQVERGEIISIVGASGAWKTTFLQILGTLNKPDSGNIIYDNTDVGTLNEEAISNFRNQNIGFVFQFHHLLPEFTALENVCIPAFVARTPRKITIEKAKEILAFLKLDNRLDHKPNELSGGQQQRVAIARALVSQPTIIMADEPTGNLDSKSSEEITAIFQRLNEEQGITIILVTHELDIAQQTHRIIRLADGRLVEDRALSPIRQWYRHSDSVFLTNL